MKLFIIPIAVMVIVHLTKIFLEIRNKKFSWRRVTGYGGMPSSHSALVTSLATVAYLETGLSMIFAVSIILALIVMRDAVGFRGYLTQHGTILNKLVKELPDEEEYKYPILEEIIAHTYAQIIIGGLLGIILAYLMY